MRTFDLRSAAPTLIDGERPEGSSTITVLSPAALLRQLNVQTIETSASRGPTVHAVPGSEGSSATGLAAEGAASGDMPRAVGRFITGRELGRGGMGRVVEARDPELKRDVAVKLLIDPSQVDELRLSRFVAEAQLTAQLDHPNIVPVYDVGFTSDGQLFFVMKKVVGRSLAEVIRALAARDEATAQFWSRFSLLMAFGQVGLAVAYAHDRGVLHRDLKPSNIMLGPYGEVMVMDWGAARVLGDKTERLATGFVETHDTPRTVDGTMIGTPGYMSPEQVRGRVSELDSRSDIFSLGAILYEMLTFTRAYPGKTTSEILHHTLAGPPQDPRERAPGAAIDAEIAEICLKAMAPTPAGRFSSTMELVFAVRTYLEARKDMPEHADCSDTTLAPGEVL